MIKLFILRTSQKNRIFINSIETENIPDHLQLHHSQKNQREQYNEKERK